MIEILILWSLCKHIGEKAKEKGQPGCALQILTIFLWFGGEIAGVIVGLILTEGEEGLLIYACGLGGAVAGAVLAYLIVNALPDRTATQDDRSYRDEDEEDRPRGYRRRPDAARPPRVEDAWADQDQPYAPREERYRAESPPPGQPLTGGTMEPWEEKMTMNKAALCEQRREWQEALQLYQSVVDRGADAVNIGNARERIDDIRDRLRDGRASW